MTPSRLADRIAALDWSGVSLQHQLAVVAACETLKRATVAEVERAAADIAPMLHHHVVPRLTPSVENVLPSPPLRAPSPELLRNSTYTPGKRITLLQLDGTPVASALLARADRWDWIVETTCSLLSCDPEQVGMVDDTVTVDGLPVFSC